MQDRINPFINIKEKATMGMTIKENRKTLFSEPENTEKKARKALERKLKARSKKCYPDGEVQIWKSGNKYTACVEIVINK